MSDLTSNLRYARDAVSYVQKKLYRGAANQADSTDDGKACVDYIRGSYLSANPSVKIPYVAQQAEAVACGNCGEQAAVAFVYLNRRGINPLVYMNLLDATGVAIHSFVVIGTDFTDGDASGWGDEAVICDAWDSAQVYPAPLITLRMSLFTNGCAATEIYAV
jgi:hypothetical protein